MLSPFPTTKNFDFLKVHVKEHKVTMASLFGEGGVQSTITQTAIHFRAHANVRARLEDVDVVSSLTCL